MPVHPVVDTYALVYDPDDPTKQIRLDAGAVGAGQTRVLSMPDRDVDLQDVLGLGVAKGLVGRDRFGNFMPRRILAGSMMVYVSEGDGETGDPHIDVVPGNIDHADLGGLATNPNPHQVDLNDLNDVNAASPTDGQVLTWDNASGEWQGRAVAAGDPVAKFRQHLIPFTLEDPVAGGAYKIGGAANALTLKRATYRTMGGSLDFNIEIRDPTTPETAGTQAWTTDKTATTSSASSPVTSFNNAGVAQYKALWVVITGIPSSSGTLYLDVIVEIDT